MMKSFKAQAISIPNILGEMRPEYFLKHFWQKKPLLIRQAIPGFKGVVSTNELRSLAASDEVQSRLIVRDGKNWEMEQGPFPKSLWKKLTPQTPWTILVQELNFHVQAADQLLEHFQFIPHARVDDVMVSHACAGGGVGPHFDSYDVFLLQGPGRRRWRISPQEDQRLRPGLPLKILKSFKHQQEWVLEPGDMLYLPPHYAHEGVAVEDCFTYSIGFRAPSAQEWVGEFLSDFAERLNMQGHYNDPFLKASAHPGELPQAMTAFLREQLKHLDFNSRGLTDFNGRYLTEPKPHVFFNPPEETLDLTQFQQSIKQHGFRLDPRTRLMYQKDQAWCNGQALNLPLELLNTLIHLADKRKLWPEEIQTSLRQCVSVRTRNQLWNWWFEWYQDGWIKIEA